jgi:hypothetical protein
VDCPGLDKEIKLQPRLSTRDKHTANYLVSLIKKAACVDVESTPLQSGGKGEEKATEIIVINSPSPPAQLSTSTFVQQTRLKPKSVALFPLNLPEADSSKAHKSFPQDYYISEVIKGLRIMSQKTDTDHISQKVAFGVIFPSGNWGENENGLSSMIIQIIQIIYVTLAYLSINVEMNR